VLRIIDSLLLGKADNLAHYRIAKRGFKYIEKLNIVGKRSGSGFIAHKAKLINALSRALSERVELMGFTIGRRGFVGYLKALGGSNIVKIIPSADSAGESQTNRQKRLKLTCGVNTSYIDNMVWIGDKTPYSICEIRISPNNSVKPNIGSLELSEALKRVLPFTDKEDTRPALQCVLFTAKEGKLTLVGADGYRLAITYLDYDDGDGQALIPRDDLSGMANALKSAKRLNLSFNKEGDNKLSDLIIDTEAIRYKWLSYDGNYPDYEKLIPEKSNVCAHIDTVEAIQAVNSLKALTDGKTYPIDLNIGSGKIILSSPDDKGQSELSAVTDGELKIRMDGDYLTEALKACGGMADIKFIDNKSPVLFSVDDYNLIVMPMLISESTQPTDEEKATEPQAEKADVVAEAKQIVKDNKPKQKKEKVAVA
jgi:DNA polymerase-3 subunit beta